MNKTHYIGDQIEIIIFFLLLTISNVFAFETPCTADQVRQNVIEFLKFQTHHEEDGTKITMENVKIGSVMPLPDFDHPTSYYVSATMKMEMTSPERSFSSENGMMSFWFDAITCEDTLIISDELEPISLEN